MALMMAFVFNANVMAIASRIKVIGRIISLWLTKRPTSRRRLLIICLGQSQVRIS
jgi:hypothetical protein